MKVKKHIEYVIVNIVWIFFIQEEEKTLQKDAWWDLVYVKRWKDDRNARSVILAESFFFPLVIK